MAFGIIFVLFTLSIDVFIFVTAGKILRRNELDPEWRKRAIVLLIFGLGIGIYFSSVHRHETPQQLRFTGFPIPLTMDRFENGTWINHNPPPLVQTLSRIVDFISGFAVALLPVKVAAFIKQVKASVRRGP